jgi:hypothetical protein
MHDANDFKTGKEKNIKATRVVGIKLGQQQIRLYEISL